MSSSSRRTLDVNLTAVREAIALCPVEAIVEDRRQVMKLSPTEIFKGKKIFFIGGTGFVGKVTLSMLLHNFPDIGKVYATVRARDAERIEDRGFGRALLRQPTFDPLREKYGDGFEDFIQSQGRAGERRCRQRISRARRKRSARR